MGLIAGFLLPLVQGLPLVLMSPIDLVAHPALLLRAIHHHRGTLCWLPNFAYNHCARRVRRRDTDGLSLASMRLFINCSEPVRHDSHQLFLDRFAAIGLRPEMLGVSYAMAENTFAVTQTPPGRPPALDVVDGLVLAQTDYAQPNDAPSDYTRPDHAQADDAQPNDAMTEYTRPDRTQSAYTQPNHAQNDYTQPDHARSNYHHSDYANNAGKSNNSRVLVSCGPPIPGTQLRVLDAAGRPLPDRRVGQIAIRSDCLLTGYYRRPDLRPFDSQGWYLTGDRGYLADGEVYVVGRVKDLIINAGQNVYPADVEAIVNEVPGVRPGRAVAFGVTDEREGTELVAVVAEATTADEDGRRAIGRAIRAAVARHMMITISYVHLVGPKWLLKTSSGKLARAANREKWLSEVNADQGLSAARL
jgi:acyl-CoA synthetase (AMP-forming)/AMP-acid ligase II